MLSRYRHRRGPYALAEQSPTGGKVRRWLTLIVFLLVLYFLGRWMLSALGVGNHVERKAATLDVENQSNVTVSLEGGLMQHADGHLKIWPEDRVATSSNAHAQVMFFDATHLRLDEQSELQIDDSNQGTRTSEIGVTLSRGVLWARTPDIESFSGTIVRTIHTDFYDAVLPSDAEVVLGMRSVLVFSADGDGVSVSPKSGTDLMIGEGQELSVPEDVDFSGDLSRFRSAMDPLAVRRPFIEESRALPDRSGSGTTSVPKGSTELLTVEMPLDGQTVTGSTVHVQGTVGARVERVRVNGYPATINREAGTYAQELALPTTDTFTIRVEALDRTGVIAQQQERTVTLAHAGTLAAPSITKPGKNGETVKVKDEELEIRGTAPVGTVAMYVNDYKLQLFRSGDTDWSYLASTRLNNLLQGTNIFTVVAEDATGKKSEPATITIILGNETGTIPAGASSSAPSVSESTLPTNDPLKPGTLAVTAPTAGTSATFTGTGFLLEGTTIKETASVWVNGYQLKLYTPGKTFWNYWATAAYGTLKPGTNVYRIVSRNAQNQILDVFTYTVEYTPSR